jgi:hypothetical protein
MDETMSVYELIATGRWGAAALAIAASLSIVTLAAGFVFVMALAAKASLGR